LDITGNYTSRLDSSMFWFFSFPPRSLRRRLCPSKLELVRPVTRVPCTRVPLPESRYPSPVYPSPITRVPLPESHYPSPVYPSPVARVPLPESRVPESHYPSPVTQVPVYRSPRVPESRYPSPVTLWVSFVRRIVELLLHDSAEGGWGLGLEVHPETHDRPTTCFKLVLQTKHQIWEFIWLFMSIYVQRFSAKVSIK